MVETEVCAHFAPHLVLNCFNFCHRTSHPNRVLENLKKHDIKIMLCRVCRFSPIYTVGPPDGIDKFWENGKQESLLTKEGGQERPDEAKEKREFTAGGATAATAKASRQV